ARARPAQRGHRRPRPRGRRGLGDHVRRHAAARRPAARARSRPPRPGARHPPAPRRPRLGPRGHPARRGVPAGRAHRRPAAVTGTSVAPGPTPLGRQAARGGAVTMGGQLLRVAVQAVSLVVLARLLEPEAFGYLAMVMALVGVAETVRDAGLANAAIQARTLSDAERDNLFWLNTVV